MHTSAVIEFHFEAFFCNLAGRLSRIHCGAERRLRYRNIVAHGSPSATIRERYQYDFPRLVP